MSPDMNKVMVMTSFLMMMVLWDTREGSAMTCPDACYPVAIDEQIEAMIPWGNGDSGNLHPSGGEGRAAGIIISGPGPDRNLGGHLFYRDNSYALAQLNPEVGDAILFAKRTGELPRQLVRPLYCSENIWSNNLDEQYLNFNRDHSYDEPEGDNPVIAGSAIMFIIGSILAGMSFRVNRHQPVSRRVHRRDIQHRHKW